MYCLHRICLFSQRQKRSNLQNKHTNNVYGLQEYILFDSSYKVEGNIKQNATFMQL